MWLAFIVGEEERTLLNRIVLAVGLGAFGLVGCGDSSSSSDGGGKDAGSTTPASGGGNQIGGFTVALSDTFASVDGKVSDGPTPPLVQWDAKATTGDCTLQTPKSLLCNPPCAAGTEVCVATNVCKPYPTAISVGEVKVSGVHPVEGTMPFTLSATNKNYYYYTPELAFPPFAEGDVVTVSAAGGTGGPFVIEARGVPPLVMTTSQNLVVSGASDLTLTWESAKAASSKIAVLVDLTHHGGTKAQIVCESADDGSLVIPKAMIASLLNYGATGYPWIVLTRSSSGEKALTSGVVRLNLTSVVSQVVQVPGVVSCTESSACDGGTCKMPDRVCQ